MIEVQFKEDHDGATSGTFEGVVSEGEEDLFPPAVKGTEDSMFFP